MQLLGAPEPALGKDPATGPQRAGSTSASRSARADQRTADTAKRNFDTARALSVDSYWNLVPAAEMKAGTVQ